MSLGASARGGHLPPCSPIINLAVSSNRVGADGAASRRTGGGPAPAPAEPGDAPAARSRSAPWCSSLRSETEEPAGNPVDLVEQVAIANEWPFHRQNDDELAAEISGHWCQYRMWFCWHPELGVMHLSCALEIKVPADKREAIYALLAMANEKLWLGHFDLWSDEICRCSAMPCCCARASM